MGQAAAPSGAVSSGGLVFCAAGSGYSGKFDSGGFWGEGEVDIKRNSWGIPWLRSARFKLELLVERYFSVGLWISLPLAEILFVNYFLVTTCHFSLADGKAA